MATSATVTAQPVDGSAIEGTASHGINNKVLWAVGTFGLSVIIKLASNVVLTRLLAPSVFGVMVVVTSIRYGVELLTDVGIEQNIVRSPRGLEDAFFNTAWTMQVIRGALLTSAFLAASPWLAAWYGIDRSVFYTISVAPFLNSLHSTAIFAAVKGLEVRRRTLFEVMCELITLILYVTLALVTPTVWALLVGTLLSVTIRSALSYLLPHPKHRLTIDRTHAKEILQFGKWIAVTSLVIYCSTNFDRVYLGRHVPMALLGIYGLARTVSELAPTLAGKISYQILFPLLSAHSPESGEPLFETIGPMRRRLTLIGAVGMGIGIAFADLAVRVVYDARYADAGWMLSLLLVGGWFSMTANLNEAVLLSTNRASRFGMANVIRFVVLAIALPLLWLWLWLGLAGAIVALVASELVRYAVVIRAQGAMRRPLLRQDAVATALLLAVVAVCLLLRATQSLGTPWGALVAVRAGVVPGA